MMPNADAIALGKHIKAVRKAMKMTQEQLALKSNVSVKYIANIENIGTQAADAHAEHLFIDAVLFCFGQAQDDDFIPLLFHRASPSLS